MELQNLLIEILNSPWHKLIVLALFVFFGYRLPDIDLAPVFLIRHRSAYTHGPLLPALIYGSAQAVPAYWPAAVGALIGMALHLIADTTPRSWQGSATIKFAPLPGSLNGPLSWLWIMAGAVTALGLLWALFAQAL